MSSCSRRAFVLLICAALSAVAQAQAPAQSSSSANLAKKPATSKADPGLDPGSVSNGLYRNKTLGFTCKIPAGWVLRTDEMNAPPDDGTNDAKSDGAKKPDSAAGKAAASSAGGRVLLAAFSRPPEAHGEEVNSSIVIAAEPVSTYSGLSDAQQYFGPLTEVARAQGFTMDEDLYEVAIGTKKLVRGDFHKDVGTRVMRQSTLAMLAHGYALSFTVIAGTEDEVEDLIDNLDFATNGK